MNISTQEQSISREWLETGTRAFAAMIEVIAESRNQVDFETYIYTDSEPGRQIREALVMASRRGVRVRILLDAFGSRGLSSSFWEALIQAGGLLRWFNPLTLRHFNIRNHRKLLVVDEKVAILGGYNVAQPWVGDGIKEGWRDLGMLVRGPLAGILSEAFNQVYETADFRHRHPQRLWPRQAVADARVGPARVLAAGPGRGPHPLRQSLMQDLREAREVRIIAAYFLPPGNLVRSLRKVARRGGKVHLILPSHSDVLLMQGATRGLYPRLLRCGVVISEYMPQILHTKFILIDDILYLGSANLDRRSLGINYDFLVRFTESGTAREAREVFERHLQHSTSMDRRTWLRSRTLWERFVEWMASALFARIDPYITRRQLRDPR